MRPQNLTPLFEDATALSGIGAKIAGALEGFIGRRVINLLWHLPINLINREYRPPLNETEEGRIASFAVEVAAHTRAPRRNLPHRVTCANESGTLDLVFFHGRPDWLEKTLPLGAKRIVSGKVDIYRGRVQMTHPDHILPPAEFNSLPKIEAVYPLTAGLGGKTLFRAMPQALARLPQLPEWQDKDFIAARGWPDWRAALLAAHAPQKEADLAPQTPARARLAYDELLASQLALALSRQARRRQKARALVGDADMLARARKLIPFSLTEAQLAAWQEISHDMAQAERMVRLLQGDVGSGKTLVALMAIVQAVSSHVQVALMVPTEILAQQHTETLAPYFDALGLRWALVTGRNKTRQRAETLAALADGTTRIAIGTHALFQDDVAFADLGLAIFDEQHRFGVQQRLRLSEKGAGVDILVMTATPIPRTLTLAAYGDMDVSRMLGKPPGRVPIQTSAASLDRYDEIADGLARVFERGARAYWVCPLVEDSAVSDLAAAEARMGDLQRRYGAQVGLVHGRMKAAEKDAVMARFKRGDIALLVATTVIEVGVDVPEATTMIIEHAERFGLSQLHQLRGRVGRGAQAASCLLLYRAPLGEAAKARLKIMRESEDGFLIAEEDLRLRGAGELLGTRQSGLPRFRLADLDAHGDFLPAIYDDVRLILERDPQLMSARGEALRILLYLFERDAALALLRAG